MTTIPWEYGAAVVINFVIFFALGIIIPLCLTGGLSTAVVQSRITDNCIGHEDRFSSIRYTTQLADSYFKQCLMNTSGISPSCSQESGIVGSTPALNFERVEACPFPGDVCQSGVNGVLIEHQALSPRDFGVNLDRRPLVDHRLTCTPLRTDPFLIPAINSYNDSAQGNTATVIWFGRQFHDPTYNGSSTAAYGGILVTRNGPNEYSSEFSGHLMASYTQPQSLDVNVFPYGSPTNRNDEIHPTLQREDGHVFVAMLRAGRSFYTEPIDDPLYAAHNQQDGFYVPDHEATAIGCVEQYRLCMSDKSFCTTWGFSTDIMMEMLEWGRANGKWIEDLAYDLLFIYPFFIDLGSVERYLSLRTGPQVLLTSLLRIRDEIQFLHTSEQWILEAHAWFVTAFLNARYSLLQVVRRQGEKREGVTQEPWLKLCQTILFRSQDHTNVDFIGLLATVSALLFLLAFSFRDEIGQVTIHVAEAIAKRWDKLCSDLKASYNEGFLLRIREVYHRNRARLLCVVRSVFRVFSLRRAPPGVNGGRPQASDFEDDGIDLSNSSGTGTGSSA
jgi:hypothetical protein